jgi:AcrR family transcriptional regulator
MPPRFSDEERARITEQLLDTGRHLFTTQGLRKTSLDDLVAPAGIAKSSFYAFFGSKEALYLELMLRQAPELYGQLGKVLAEAGDARAALAGFLRVTARILEENPLYNRLVTHPDEMSAVTRRLGPDELAKVGQLIPLPEFLDKAETKGQLVEADTSELLGVLQAVLLLPLHRKEIGEERYPAVLDRLVDIVAAGLTKG